MAIKKTSSSKPKAAAKPKAKASTSKSKASTTKAKAAAKPKTSGPKKSPAKKAAIKASSATVRKLAEKGRAASTGAKKKATAASKTKAPRTKREEASAPKRINPEGRALAERAAALVLEKKADEVVVIDVCGRTGYTDFLVVASAETERQVAAIAEHVEITLKGEGHRVISAEGHAPGQWILLDYGDAIVHLFTGEARPFYDLEGMWPDAPRETLR